MTSLVITDVHQGVMPEVVPCRPAGGAVHARPRWPGLMVVDDALRLLGVHGHSEEYAIFERGSRAPEDDLHAWDRTVEPRRALTAEPDIGTRLDSPVLELLVHPEPCAFSPRGPFGMVRPETPLFRIRWKV